MTDTDDFMVERATLMAEGDLLRVRARESFRADRVDEAFADYDRIDEIAQRYRELLPEVTVARCPHSGALVRWPIETAGLDGWFWEYLAATRRPPADLPPTWLAMSGAMRLRKPVEHPPYAVVPGPDVPFVVPRILRGPGVRAVLSEVSVGVHTGWVISYFGPPPVGVRLVNLWGTNTYRVGRDGVGEGWDWDIPGVSQYDFELTEWLRSGALLWIAPGDASATLREGPGGCPYTKLRGRQKITVISNGVVQRVAEFVGNGAG
ncbi:hypothetical protein F4560_007397 [Saccharothrix ecbatanensis]|uniref:Uncharacterized protein n=1 Tax=Saccharothrix ecbatanensis TaxID=1105145 RepID=A0A7W9M549_9PSEU|nr:hypothetical protein [Saccharothrix ecbatanensis]MBB5807629.1 hypothetical protein [Saccharothrix ecbatanensis]